MNKKYRIRQQKLKKVKAPAAKQVKVQEKHKMYRKALTKGLGKLGYLTEACRTALPDQLYR